MDKEKILIENGLDYLSIQKFRSMIKSVSTKESNRLGREIYRLGYYQLEHEQERLKELILNGANLNYQDPENGYTVLLICASHNCIETVKLLLLGGADVNLCNFVGESPLMNANPFDLIVAKILIAMGADVNHKDKYCRTVIARAIDLHSVEFVKLLLEEGVDTSIKMKYKYNKYSEEVDALEYAKETLKLFEVCDEIVNLIENFNRVSAELSSDELVMMAKSDLKRLLRK